MSIQRFNEFFVRMCVHLYLAKRKNRNLSKNKELVIFIYNKWIPKSLYQPPDTKIDNER
jgi:hypothetical protein